MGIYPNWDRDKPIVNDWDKELTVKGFKRFDLSVLAQYIFQPITRLVIIGILLVIGLTARTAIIAYCVATFTATGAMIPERCPDARTSAQGRAGIAVEEPR